MKSIKGLVAGAAFVLATAASADTITVDWNNPIFGALGARDVGVVTHPGGSINTDAGRFHGVVTATTGVSTSELIDSGANFFAYCHDLAQTIGDTTYTVQYGASAIMRDFLGAVNSVLGGDPYAWLRPDNKHEAAAIQLGIWEALHGDDFNLATGLVQFSGSPGATALGLFDSFVAAMATSESLSNDRVMVLVHNGKQDVITGIIPPSRLVPEPGTLALLGMAVVAVAATTRRRMR